MAMYELDGNHLLPVRLGRSADAITLSHSLVAIQRQIVDVLRRPLFPLAWDELDGGASLTALDATGQVVAARGGGDLLRYESPINPSRKEWMMNYNITGKHLDISDAVRSYVEEKLGKLEMQQITSTQITLRAENHLKIAEATLHLASGKTIHGDAAHEDMYAAIDLLADVLDKQIRKHKEKISEHR